MKMQLKYLPKEFDALVTFCLIVFTANCGSKSHWFISNKCTVPNKTVLLGKIPKINKRTVYVYLDP